MVTIVLYIRCAIYLLRADAVRLVKRAKCLRRNKPSYGIIIWMPAGRDARFLSLVASYSRLDGAKI